MASLGQEHLANESQCPLQWFLDCVVDSPVLLEPLPLRIGRITMNRVALICLVVCFSTIDVSGQQQLKPTPKTVAWGYYDASTPPVLRIKSGDKVEIQTLITSSPTRLEGAGLPPSQVAHPLPYVQ